MFQVHSSVRGYVWRDKFYGTVATSTVTLHIEPIVNTRPVSSKYVRGINRAVNAYVYRVFSKRRSHNKKYKQYKARQHTDLSNYQRKLLRLRIQRSARQKQKRRRESGVCRSCSLLLIADQSFYEEVGEMSVKQSVLQMVLHVREANILMRRQDFDRDGVADCVGVHVAGIGVITDNTSHTNLLSGSYRSPEEYLRRFSRYQLDGYCLAILFSSKVFPGKVLGLSWRGDRQKSSGICRSRTNVGTNSRPEMFNLNTLFITLRTKKTERIPLRMGVLNLVHEIFHSFGAEHDPDTRECRATARHGRYIMSRFSNTGIKRNNEIISNCTARSISTLLSSSEMSYCLHPRDGGYCGDGVVDHEEECDCGGMEECLEKKSLCNPPGLRKGEIECHFRKTQSRKVIGKMRQGSECSRLGLESCDCPGASNSVTCTSCCTTKGGDCRPAKEWTKIMFDYMQHYLARLCWAESVSTCISTSSKWSRILGLLSQQNVVKEGTVFCLKTGRDSNCWQLSFFCDSDLRYNNSPL